MLMVMALAGTTSGCVERLITGSSADTDVSGASSTFDDSDDGSSTSDESSSSSSGFVFETEAPECFMPEDCGADQTCFEGTCVGSGELRVSLSWQVVSDFDLHVITPQNVHISFENTVAGGGVLDVDDCVGDCANNDGIHVENIFFPDDPPRGTYQVWVHNFDGRRAGEFNVTVTGAANTSFSGSLPSSSQSSPRFEFTVP